MNIRALWYFLSAVSAGGVGAGAKRIGIAQSTMSGALRGLETELGSPLFESTHIGLRPTAAAVRLRDYAMWLTTETEQVFLDMKVGCIGSLEPIPVHTYGVMRCSLADWAIVQGLFTHVARNGGRRGLVCADYADPAETAPAGIAIRYRLVAARRSISPEENRVSDEWVLVTFPDASDIAGEVAWEDLAKLRLVVPSLAQGIEEELASAEPSLKVEPGKAISAGAPYMLLEHKDAALLTPRSSLPTIFASAGVRILPVVNAPVVPELQVKAAAPRTSAEWELARSVAEALTGALNHAHARSPRMNLLDARVDMHALRCFCSTVETGNTARAAKACFIVQPALSGQIKKLENAVSRQLFSRSRAGMTPTPAGRRLHSLIEPVLGDHAAAVDRLRDGFRRGQRTRGVRLGIIPAANEDSLIAESAADALSRWRMEFNDTPISVAEGYTSVLLRWLRTHLIDLAIIDTTEDQPGIQVMPIFREPITLVFAPGSTWDTGLQTIEGHALSSGKLVIPSRRFGLRSLFDKTLSAAGVNVAPDLEVDSLAIALKFVRSGDWATVLPPSAVHRQLREGQLKRRLMISPGIERQICAAWRSRTELECATASLLHELEEAFHANASAGETEFVPKPPSGSTQ